MRGREHVWTDLGWKDWVNGAAVSSGAAGTAELGVGHSGWWQYCKGTGCKQQLKSLTARKQTERETLTQLFPHRIFFKDHSQYDFALEPLPYVLQLGFILNIATIKHFARSFLSLSKITPDDFFLSKGLWKSGCKIDFSTITVPKHSF